MVDTTAVLTPVMTDLSEKVGRKRYRKALLKVGSIDYKGNKIDFTREYLSDLVKSFTDEAYDQVPFVLADENNQHNELPERFRGELDSLELTDDTLYGIISANRDGAKILDDNPNLGVSARIIEGLGKSDGRVFKRAIRHVCGTMDPRISGLGPFQPVDLSDETNDEIETVDLSAASYTEGKPMARKKAASKKQRVLDLSALTDDQFQALLDMSTEVEVEDDDEVETDENGVPVVTPDDVEDETDDESDDEDETDDETDEVTDPPKKKRKVTEKVTETDLSVSIVDTNTRETVTQMQIDLAQERFDNYRETMIREGVPPHLIDLAEPLLNSPEGAVIDLSNADEPVNATQIVRDLLQSVRGVVDLTPEIGHTVDLSHTDKSEDDALIALWDKEYGAV